MGETVDLQAVKAEIEAIRSEALAYGYSLQGEKLSELRGEIGEIRLERAGKPACYKRLFSHAAAECQLCDLRPDCSGITGPMDVDPEAMRFLACSKCDGMLNVALRDSDAKIQNYGCSTEGCTNTLVDQALYQPEAPPDEASAPVKPPDKLEIAILNAVRKAGKLPSKRAIIERVKGGRNRVLERIKRLTETGMLTYARGKGYAVDETCGKTPTSP